MRVIYDETGDILYIRLREGEYDESDKVYDGLIVDFDVQGKPIAIEVLGASELLGTVDRLSLEFARKQESVPPGILTWG